MRPLHSIRWRLQFWHGLVLALVLCGFGLTAWEFQRTEVLRSGDEDLARRVTMLAAAIRPGPPAIRQAPPRPREDDEAPDEDPEAPPEAPPRHRPLKGQLEAADPSAFSGSPATGLYYAAWVGHTGRYLSSSGAPPGVPKPQDAAGAAERGPRLRSRGPWREAWLPLRPGDCILVGRSTAEAQAGLRRLAWTLAGAGAAIFCLGLAGGGWLGARALRPIDDIQDAAAAIAAGDLARRIATRDRRSELGQLAQALNGTFARLEASFAQQARFTADAAHELRTPVTVILAHTQNALAEACLVDGHREALEACHRSAQRMRGLVEALLELARLDDASQPVRRSTFDLAETARDALELVRALADGRGLSLTADLQSTPCRGDALQIGQVVANLLSNAVHHNRPGGSIAVSVRRAADGSSLLVVSDTGPGIPEVHIPHIFERFYRVDAARGGASGRTGLGLAISKAIVEAHRGRIEVLSPPGKGATFTVILPP